MILKKLGVKQKKTVRSHSWLILSILWELERNKKKLISYCYRGLQVVDIECLVRASGHATNENEHYLENLSLCLLAHTNGRFFMQLNLDLIWLKFDMKQSCQALLLLHHHHFIVSISIKIYRMNATTTRVSMVWIFNKKYHTH